MPTKKREPLEMVPKGAGKARSHSGARGASGSPKPPEPPKPLRKTGKPETPGERSERGHASGSLTKYRAKRSPEGTPEPFGSAVAEGVAHETSGLAGGGSPETPSRLFVIQKHAARRLHYDLRLEWGGTLHSWAVPNGLPLSPTDRRLAVEVEDHPIEYADFEGLIPEGNYGAGAAIVWDRGH
jgi:bifunctional non-homologous end joining protein LigD